MSHLVKNNNLILKYIRFFFYICILITITSGSYFYEGNKLIFLLFGLLSNLIFFFVFSKKTYFFEIFFGGLLWLGFWYKSLIIIIFFDYELKEGANSFMKLSKEDQIQVFDNSLIVICYGLAGFLLACLIKNTLLNNFYNIKKNLKKNINNLNIKFFIFILLIFIITYLIITYTNFHLSIYQRGVLQTYSVHFTISAIYKWLLLFGFSTFIAFIFIFSFQNKSKIYLVSTMSIVETFITNLSFLSRGMIFNLFAIFIGLYKSNKLYKLKLNLKFFLIYLLSIMCFFYLCVISVNYLRANVYFNKTIETKKYDTNKKAFDEFLLLSKTRWVGIDALISVESFEGKSFNFFKQSFNEQFDKNKIPFYERNVQKRIKTENKAKQYGITTPGIIAFLYYTGSKNFVFFIIFLISILFLTFEKFIFIVFKNPILCSMLSQVLAYRLIHFGYMPQNTYMLLTSILITIMGLFLMKKFLTNNRI